jgi:hypothetical protein
MILEGWEDNGQTLDILFLTKQETMKWIAYRSNYNYWIGLHWTVIPEPDSDVVVKKWIGIIGKGFSIAEISHLLIEIWFSYSSTI